MIISILLHKLSTLLNAIQVLKEVRFQKCTKQGEKVGPY
jgi:hypothetical protein